MLPFHTFDIVRWDFKRTRLHITRIHAVRARKLRSEFIAFPLLATAGTISNNPIGAKLYFQRVSSRTEYTFA